MDLSAVSAADFASAIDETAPAPAGLIRFARRHALALIVGLGLAIRLALLITPRSYFPDEIFQYLEPAHRLVFGTGIVTWEYRYGIRSWLVPLALAGPMAVGGWLSPTGGAYLLFAKVALVLLSLTSIFAAWALGRRISTAHAIFAAFITAIWSDFVYFSGQALTEAIAVSSFLPAAALLYDRSRETTGRLVLAGALIALTGIIRFQYGPAAGLLLVMACGLDGRRWRACLGGVVLALAMSAILDLAMGQRPFSWLVENIRQNIVSGRSHAWGVTGPLFFVVKLGENWSFWTIPILLLGYTGAKRYPALGAAAILNLVVHSAIAHKEFRYLLLSLLLVVLLAAIGTVDAIVAAGDRKRQARLFVIAFASWIAASILTGLAPYDLRSMATPKLQAFAALRAQPALCGVALSHVDWFQTGGYAYLHRRVPLYVPDLTKRPDRSLGEARAAYDTIVAGPTAHAIPAGFTQTGCFGNESRRPDQAVCVYQRPGNCDPRVASRLEINHVLRELDQ